MDISIWWTLSATTVWQGWRDIVLYIATMGMTYHFLVLDFFVSMRVAYIYRETVGFRLHWTQSFKNCFISYLGGTTLAGIVRSVPPGWARSNGSVIAVTVAWYCVMFFPRDLVVRTCIKSNGMKVSPLGELGVEQTIRNPDVSSSVTTALICGILCSCGGGIVSDWLNLRLLSRDERAHVQIPLKQGILRSVFGTIVYYIIRDPHSHLWSRFGMTGLQASDAICTLATLDMMITVIYPDAVNVVSTLLEMILPGFKAEFVPNQQGIELKGNETDVQQHAPNKDPATSQEGSTPTKEGNRYLRRRRRNK